MKSSGPLYKYDADDYMSFVWGALFGLLMWLLSLAAYEIEPVLGHLINWPSIPLLLILPDREFGRYYFCFGPLLTMIGYGWAAAYMSSRDGR